MDALCIGESMVLIAPDPPHPISEGTRATFSCAGAESNVAINLARLGLRAAWRGRLGTDPFADIVTSALRQAGVVTDLIEYDASAPTGIYVKDPQPSGTQVYYYRSTSAASQMTPEFVTALPAARIWHLSGITPALSPSCQRMTNHALTATEPPLRSFDINYRPKLWESPDDAAMSLQDLGNRSDLCFVGLDEAQSLWGTASAAEVRRVLPGPETLVVKDSHRGATALTTTGEEFFVATTPADVHEPVGAGDAFASGYLFGLLKGVSTEASLKLGHLMARQSLTVSGDIGPLPPSDAIADLLT